MCACARSLNSKIISKILILVRITGWPHIQYLHFDVGLLKCQVACNIQSNKSLIVELQVPPQVEICFPRQKKESVSLSQSLSLFSF